MMTSLCQEAHLAGSQNDSMLEVEFEAEMAVWTAAQCSDEPGVAFPAAVFAELRVE